MPASSSDVLDDFYRFLWPSSENDPERFAFLDQDLDGRPWAEILHELAVEQGVGPDTVVLDAGCGKGRQACMLAADFGSQVIALDVLEHNLNLARERAKAQAVSDLIQFVSASLEALPLRDERLDVVWCIDMLNHVVNIEVALRECARVLAPGGRMLVGNALGTELLEPGEVARLCEPMSINPVSLSPTAFVDAAARAGLAIRGTGSTFDVTSRYFEPLSPDAARDVVRLARMMRTKSDVVERLGEEAYRQLEGYYIWNLYLLIGKLIYHVWMLEK